MGTDWGLPSYHPLLKNTMGMLDSRSNESGGAFILLYLPYYKEFNQDTDIKQLILSGSKMIYPHKFPKQMR